MICKNQTGLSLRTMEVEFIATSQAGRELLGLKGMFGELRIPTLQPMKMWMDNLAAIRFSKIEKNSSSAKLVDIRLKFICHYTQSRIVHPDNSKSEDMVADLLTKALPGTRITALREIFKLKTIQFEAKE